MAEAVEHAMEAERMDINLTPEEKFEVFGDFDPDRYADEAHQRWGGTDAYKESARRAATFTKEDWKRFQAEADEINRRFAELLDAGASAESDAAMDVAEEHRGWIGRHCYTCSHEMHTCLGEMYVADERFTAYYDTVRPGLAVFVRDAILANAVRNV